MNMSLVRLIYVSRMTEACDMTAIQEILKVSRKRNTAGSITGILCYDPAFFMQCLEGPKDAVNELYRDIARDKRHTQVTLLEYEEIEERAFGEWSMAFVLAHDMDKRILRKYSGRKTFDPFALSPGQAHNLMVEFAKQHRKQSVEPRKNRSQ